MKNIAFLLLLVSLLTQADEINYICSYPEYSDRTGSHNPKEVFLIMFIVDKKTNKAYMTGNLGTDEVIFLESPDKKSVGFISVPDMGNVMSTAIDESLDSVHSRNTIIYGKLIPSQFYGNCKIY